MSLHSLSPTIAVHSSVVNPFRLPSISAQLRSFKPRPTAQLSMQRLGSRSTAYTTLCGSPAGYATPSLPLITGAAAELSRDRGRNRMNEHQWDSIIPYYFIIFYLTTFLLTFSTILLLKGKGTIQIFHVFVTGLSRFFTRKVVQL